jgi:hypothetical protein
MTIYIFRNHTNLRTNTDETTQINRSEILPVAIDINIDIRSDSQNPIQK